MPRLLPSSLRSLACGSALIVWLLTSSLCLAADESASTAEQLEFFEKKIRPVLVKHCYECHAQDAEKVKGGLWLDTREATRSGGETGSAVVPGKPAESLLLDAIRYESFEMPPSGKLSDAVIADFEAWIRMGAPDPREGSARVPDAKTINFTTARQFWSFQAPQTHVAGLSENVEWGTRPIDQFVLQELESVGLQPNSPADRRTLIRRVTFDLTGLPPTPAEVDAFVADPSPQAYSQLVERLLSSPHYGERWTRLWLDVARYAEDQAHIVGKNSSLFYPNAYLYRDWVIQALNDDVPYDRFIKLQLAGDLLEPDNVEQHVALGFIGLGPKYYRRNAPEVMADEWEDRVDTVTRGLQGLTVACARCHDHKYDPIPTADYYALAGVFASTEMFNRPLSEDCETDKNGEAKTPADGLHIIRDAKPQDLNIFIRGDINSKGPVVERHFLQVLGADSPIALTQGSGRLQLAEAIADRNNPLTARVIVNRIWAQYFGTGLVATPSNFGQLGERPSHPELLDDLAVRFMDAGWSLKWLHREIVLSATYQQSSRIDPAKQSLDPANRLLGRMNRRRLSIEQWRDAILSVSGRLDHSVGGPSIDPNKPQETRRTVYSRISRLDLNPLLARFDFPDPNAHNPRRSQTTTPLQKLFVLNSPFMVRQADALADRLLAPKLESNAETTDAERVNAAYAWLFGRPAEVDEVAWAVEFVSQAKDEEQRTGLWKEYAQVLLASNEFLMLD